MVLFMELSWLVGQKELLFLSFKQKFALFSGNILSREVLVPEFDLLQGVMIGLTVIIYPTMKQTIKTLINWYKKIL